MNRKRYFDYIADKLVYLASNIEIRGGLNLLDIHLHSEDFYQKLINMMFDWDLKNINLDKQNAAGIDLCDTTNKIIVQVSAKAKKEKIESALSKESLGQYKGYCFKFISISKNADGLRKQAYLNPHNLSFSPDNDIYDVESILRLIKSFDVDKQKNIYEFIKKELYSEPDLELVETNLAQIIKILSKVNWNNTQKGPLETKSFEIEEKIAYNQLDTARIFIDDYKIHSHRISKIYSEFDKEGVNKSLSILNGIRTVYTGLLPGESPDQVFTSIFNQVSQKVRESANYNCIPDEELQLCVQILVVDAFIRCKIFKNPTLN